MLFRSDLDTRHLGSVYEGLLEHQFEIAPEDYAAVAEDGGQVWKPADEVTVAEAVETVPEGGLYVVNDEGERKATGAYYTPDYVVSYIVEETVGPLVEEVREDLRAQGFEPGTQEYIGAFLRRAKALKVLDPAMGSAHFLTSATGYLAEEVMSEVREVEEQVGADWDENLVRREIAKECIYGVDVNGMAVELGKLSMWLETLAADRPLAFLDHHLKQGNSLVGSDVTAVLSNGAESDDGQLTLQQSFARVRERTLDHVMDLMRELLEVDNETLDDIKSMEELYDEIRSDALYQRLFELTNVHTAEEFGVDVPENAYEEMAGSIENPDDWAELRDEPWFREAQRKARSESFFHWELEFPGVFFDADGEKREDAGFDAVIGNPPYLDAWRMTEEMPELRESINRLHEDKGVLTGHWDLYVAFVAHSVDLTNKNGRQSFILPNTLLTEKYTKELRRMLLSGHQVQSILDFEERKVFPNVDRQCVVYVVEKEGDTEEPHSLRKCIRQEPFEYEEITRVSSEVWLSVYNYQIRVDQRYVEGHLPLIKKIDANSDSLGQYLYVNVGATVSSKEKGNFSKEDVIYEEPVGNAKKFFQGTNLQRYRINWEEEWLDYREEEMSGPRHPEMFEADKIAIRVRTDKGGKLAAAFDDSSMYCDHTVLVCCDYRHLEETDATTEFEGFEKFDKIPDLRFVTSLINSTFMTWIFKYKFETGGLQGTYSDVWPQSVRSFPIPDSEIYQSTIEDENLSYEDKLTELYSQNSEYIRKLANLNLSLLDYLGVSDDDDLDGDRLGDLYMPPAGLADSMVSKTAEDLEGLRVEGVDFEEDGTRLVMSVDISYKPDEDDPRETDTYGRLAETEFETYEAMVFTGLSDEQETLVRNFVPVAVDEAGGFAGFRQSATKTNSLVDRLEALTLPDVGATRDGLERYIDVKERADELDEKIERTDALIDEIVYDLYGLTDEEIEIVEEAVED